MTMMMNMGLGTVGDTLMIWMETRFMIISKCLMLLHIFPLSALLGRLDTIPELHECYRDADVKRFTCSAMPGLFNKPL
jgi:hypothetical protein